LGCFGFLCSRLLLWPLAMLFSCADCVTWAAAFDYPHGNTGSGLLVTSRSRCRQSSCSSVTHPALCKRTANARSVVHSGLSRTISSSLINSFRVRILASVVTKSRIAVLLTTKSILCWMKLLARTVPVS
jgi:hypothetical protein